MNRVRGIKDQILQLLHILYGIGLPSFQSPFYILLLAFNLCNNNNLEIIIISSLQMEKLCFKKACSLQVLRNSSLNQSKISERESQ